MGYNKIILQGNQTSDYLYIESSPKNDGQFEYETGNIDFSCSRIEIELENNEIIYL